MTNIPSPYRVDFFNELGKYCQLTVVFERETAKDRNKKWKSDEFTGFTSVFLKSIKVRDDASFSLGILSILKEKYDIIILGGYASPTYGIAMEYLKLRKIPFVMNADGGFVKKDRKIIHRIKSHYISMAKAWLSTGRLTDQYLMYYGAKQEFIYRYPFTSVKMRDLVPPDVYKKGILKRQLGIAEEKMVLAVGQLIPRKGVDLLINAAEAISGDAGIYIVGGEPSIELSRMAEERRGGCIHFLDFMSKKELLKYYQAADVFVFPTREDIWGLVLNEAMSCGVPSVASKFSIAAAEMIEDGENGFIINPLDSREIIEKINCLLADEKLAAKMGQKAFDTSKIYTIEKMAIRHMEIFNELLKEW